MFNNVLQLVPFKPPPRLGGSSNGGAWCLGITIEKLNGGFLVSHNLSLVICSCLIKQNVFPSLYIETFQISKVRLG